MESELDLSFLDEVERQKIICVLRRDAELHKNDQERKKKLSEKAARTQNIIIQKKIKMRSGEWFTEMMKKRQNHKRSGTDIVRASMRRAKPYSKAPHQRRSAPGPPAKPEPMETQQTPYNHREQEEVQPTATPPSSPLMHKQQEYTNESVATVMVSSTPDLYTRTGTSASDNSSQKYESKDLSNQINETVTPYNISNTVLDNSLITTTPTLPVKKYSSENTTYDSDDTQGSETFWKTECDQITAKYNQQNDLNYQQETELNYQENFREGNFEEKSLETTSVSVDINLQPYNYPENGENLKKRSLVSIDENSELEEPVSELYNEKANCTNNKVDETELYKENEKDSESSSDTTSNYSNSSHECNLATIESTKKELPLIEVTEPNNQNDKKLSEEEKLPDDIIKPKVKVTGVDSSDSNYSQNEEFKGTYKSEEIEASTKESSNWFKKHVDRKKGSYDLTSVNSEESSESGIQLTSTPIKGNENEQIEPQFIESVKSTIDQTLLYDKLSDLANEDENKIVEPPVVEEPVFLGEKDVNSPILSDNEQYTLTEILSKLAEKEPSTKKSSQSKTQHDLDESIQVKMFNEEGNLRHVSTTSSEAAEISTSNKLVDEVISEAINVVDSELYTNEVILEENGLAETNNQELKNINVILEPESKDQTYESEFSNQLIQVNEYAIESLQKDDSVDLPVYNITYTEYNNKDLQGVKNLQPLEELETTQKINVENIDASYSHSISQEFSQDTKPEEKVGEEHIQIGDNNNQLKTTVTNSENIVKNELEINKDEDSITEEEENSYILKSSIRKSSLRSPSPIDEEHEVKHVRFTDEDTSVRMFVPDSDSDKDLLSDSDDENSSELGKNFKTENFKTASWNVESGIFGTGDDDNNNKSIDSDSDSDSDPTKYFHVYGLKPAIPEIVITCVESESESEKDSSGEDFEIEIENDDIYEQENDQTFIYSNNKDIVEEDVSQTPAIVTDSTYSFDATNTQSTHNVNIQNDVVLQMQNYDTIESQNDSNSSAGVSQGEEITTQNIDIIKTPGNDGMNVVPELDHVEDTITQNEDVIDIKGTEELEDSTKSALKFLQDGNVGPKYYDVHKEQEFQSDIKIYHENRPDDYVVPPNNDLTEKQNHAGSHNKNFSSHVDEPQNNLESYYHDSNVFPKDDNIPERNKEDVITSQSLQDDMKLTDKISCGDILSQNDYVLDTTNYDFIETHNDKVEIYQDETKFFDDISHNNNGLTQNDDITKPQDTKETEFDDITIVQVNKESSFISQEADVVETKKDKFTASYDETASVFPQYDVITEMKVDKDVITEQSSQDDLKSLQEISQENDILSQNDYVTETKNTNFVETLNNKVKISQDDMKSFDDLLQDNYVSTGNVDITESHDSNIMTTQEDIVVKLQKNTKPYKITQYDGVIKTQDDNVMENQNVDVTESLFIDKFLVKIASEESFSSQTDKVIENQEDDIVQLQYDIHTSQDFSQDFYVSPQEEGKIETKKDKDVLTTHSAQEDDILSLTDYIHGTKNNNFVKAQNNKIKISQDETKSFEDFSPDITFLSQNDDITEPKDKNIKETKDDNVIDLQDDKKSSYKTSQNDDFVDEKIDYVINTQDHDNTSTEDDKETSYKLPQDDDVIETQNANVSKSQFDNKFLVEKANKESFSIQTDDVIKNQDDNIIQPQDDIEFLPQNICGFTHDDVITEIKDKVVLTQSSHEDGTETSYKLLQKDVVIETQNVDVTESKFDNQCLVEIADKESVSQTDDVTGKQDDDTIYIQEDTKSSPKDTYVSSQDNDSLKIDEDKVVERAPSTQEYSKLLHYISQEDDILFRNDSVIEVKNVNVKISQDETNTFDDILQDTSNSTQNNDITKPQDSNIKNTQDDDVVNLQVDQKPLYEVFQKELQVDDAIILPDTMKSYSFFENYDVIETQSDDLIKTQDESKFDDKFLVKNAGEKSFSTQTNDVIENQDNDIIQSQDNIKFSQDFPQGIFVSSQSDVIAEIKESKDVITAQSSQDNIKSLQEISQEKDILSLNDYIIETKNDNLIIEGQNDKVEISQNETIHTDDFAQVINVSTQNNDFIEPQDIKETQDDDITNLQVDEMSSYEIFQIGDVIEMKTYDITRSMDDNTDTTYKILQNDAVETQSDDVMETQKVDVIKSQIDNKCLVEMAGKESFSTQTDDVIGKQDDDIIYLQNDIKSSDVGPQDIYVFSQEDVTTETKDEEDPITAQLLQDDLDLLNKISHEDDILSQNDDVKKAKNDDFIKTQNNVVEITQHDTKFLDDFSQITCVSYQIDDVTENQDDDDVIYLQDDIKSSNVFPQDSYLSKQGGAITEIKEDHEVITAPLTQNDLELLHKEGQDDKVVKTQDCDVNKLEDETKSLVEFTHDDGVVETQDDDVIKLQDETKSLKEFKQVVKTQEDKVIKLQDKTKSFVEFTQDNKVVETQENKVTKMQDETKSWKEIAQDVEVVETQNDKVAKVQSETKSLKEFKQADESVETQDGDEIKLQDETKSLKEFTQVVEVVETQEDKVVKLQDETKSFVEFEQDSEVVYTQNDKVIKLQDETKSLKEFTQVVEVVETQEDKVIKMKVETKSLEEFKKDNEVVETQDNKVIEMQYETKFLEEFAQDVKVVETQNDKVNKVQSETKCLKKIAQDVEVVKTQDDKIIKLQDETKSFVEFKQGDEVFETQDDKVVKMQDETKSLKEFTQVVEVVKTQDSDVIKIQDETKSLKELTQVVEVVKTQKDKVIKMQVETKLLEEFKQDDEVVETQDDKVIKLQDRTKSFVEFTQDNEVVYTQDDEVIKMQDETKSFVEFTQDDKVIDTQDDKIIKMQDETKSSKEIAQGDKVVETLDNEIFGGIELQDETKSLVEFTQDVEVVETQDDKVIKLQDEAKTLKKIARDDEVVETQDDEVIKLQLETKSLKEITQDDKVVETQNDEVNRLQDKTKSLEKIIEDDEVVETQDSDVIKSQDQTKSSEDFTQNVEVVETQDGEVIKSQDETESLEDFTQNDNVMEAQDNDITLTEDTIIQCKMFFSGEIADMQPNELQTDDDINYFEEEKVLDETLKYDDTTYSENSKKIEQDNNLEDGIVIKQNDSSETFDSGSDSDSNRPHKRFGSSRRKPRHRENIEMSEEITSQTYDKTEVTEVYQTTENIVVSHYEDKVKDETDCSTLDEIRPETSSNDETPKIKENYLEETPISDSGIGGYEKDFSLPGNTPQGFENPDYYSDNNKKSREVGQNITGDLSYYEGEDSATRTEFDQFVESGILRPETNTDDEYKLQNEDSKTRFKEQEIVEEAVKQEKEKPRRVIKRLGSSRRKKEGSAILIDPVKYLENIEDESDKNNENLTKSVTSVSENIDNKMDDSGDDKASVLLTYKNVVEPENENKTENLENDDEIADIFKKVDSSYNEQIELSEKLQENVEVEENKNVEDYVSEEQKKGLPAFEQGSIIVGKNITKPGIDTVNTQDSAHDEHLEPDIGPTETEKYYVDMLSEDSEMKDSPKVVKKIVRVVKKASNKDIERSESPEASAEMDKQDSEKLDKVDELSSAVNFLNTLDSQEGSQPQALKNKKKSFLSSSMQSLNTLGKHKSNERFGSNWSVYSATSGHGVDVSGTIELGFEYNYKTGTLNIKVGGCTNLAPVDEKKLSNPYVKTYMLPDKDSKRKTKTKKRTLNPRFDETLKYVISDSELSTRTLNVAVWHDKVGTNYFLGEVIIDFNEINLKKATKMTEYQLFPKGLLNSSANTYSGDIEVALRLLADGDDQGQLEIVLKNVNNIPSLKSDGTSSVFVKGYFLPDKSHQTKQKTPLLCGVTNINFDHLFVYTGVQMSEIDERCLELTVYHYEKYGSNRLIGGARIGPGTGVSFNEPAKWMDSQDEEVQLWRRLMASNEEWVKGTLFLRKFQPLS